MSEVTDDLHSLSRGVFVIPYQPSSSEAGPSRPKRTLHKLYDATYDTLQKAYKEYERERMEVQLDDIERWLERCDAPPLLKRTARINRLSVGIIQNIAETLPQRLAEVEDAVYTLSVKDALDLNSALRAMAQGFTGEDVATAKKSGRSGMDLIERWYDKQKDPPVLLLHIQNAQMISPTVLSELLYVIAIHPALHFRVLLSVSSMSTFLASWTHDEPALIDLSISQAGKGKKRSGAVHAILRAGQQKQHIPLAIHPELAEEIAHSEEITGGGAAAALKSLKWSILQQSVNSPLTRVQTTAQNAQVQAITRALQDDPEAELPGRGVLEIHPHRDLIVTHDPAPRISILHSLANTAAFAPSAGLASVDGDDTPRPNSSSRSRAPDSPATPSRRSRNNKFATPDVPERAEDEPTGQGGDMKELETLFNLWRSAGRNVNLWDWLQGFKASLHQSEQAEELAPDEKSSPVGDGEDDGRPAKRQRQVQETQEGVSEEAVKVDEIDPEEEDRLHATFIRFCEEARMLGLVRARGRRRGADEVVKGIVMV